MITRQRRLKNNKIKKSNREDHNQIRKIVWARLRKFRRKRVRKLIKRIKRSSPMKLKCLNACLSFWAASMRVQVPNNKTGSTATSIFLFHSTTPEKRPFQVLCISKANFRSNKSSPNHRLIQVSQAPSWMPVRSRKAPKVDIFHNQCLNRRGNHMQLYLTAFLTRFILIMSCAWNFSNTRILYFDSTTVLFPLNLRIWSLRSLWFYSTL